MNTTISHKAHTSSPPQVSSDSLIRQLAWSVTSPPLLMHNALDTWPAPHWFELQRHALQPLLSALADHTQTLQEFISSERDIRLGARFERLLEFWMEQHPAIDVLARRLQFAQDGRTIGEFDFLVRTACISEQRALKRSETQIEHWEVACKFYLGLPVNNVMHWVGPGKRDSLVRKVKRIQTHQLTLSQRDGARAMLQDRGIGVDTTRAVLKGRLFYPLPDQDTEQKEVSAPVCESLPGGLTVHAAHERGFWCDYNNALLGEARSIVLLEKSLWLDPALQTEGPQLDRAALAELCQQAPQCCDIQRADGVGMRMFVVAPGWFDDLSESLSER